MTKFDFNAWLTVDKRRVDAVRDENLDAAWADYGRTVNHRIMCWHFVQAVNRALLRSRSNAEVASALKSYLHTGVLP